MQPPLASLSTSSFPAIELCLGAQLISALVPACCKMLVAVLMPLLTDLSLVSFQLRARIPAVDRLSLNIFRGGACGSCMYI